MFSFLFDIGNYEDRKVARDTVGRCEVSTAFSSDEGYETAIIDSDGNVYPVERYPDDRELVLLGHKTWVKKLPKLKKIVCLDGIGGLAPAKEITLKK